MIDIETFINSGILQAYVLGVCDAQEILEVEKMAESSIEISNEIDKISEELERVALANAVAPDPIIKPMLLATIDYMERMNNGEAPTFPPLLHQQSSIADYNEWLSRTDMIAPAELQDIQVRVIGYTPEVMTAIVWIKEMAPQEVHSDEFEKFLIVEGTCELTIGDEVHKLVAGSFMSIPLHVNHHVRVTSTIPCKVILQRIAA